MRHGRPDLGRPAGGGLGPVDVLMLVRHAEAGIKGGWDGPDVLRPLSPAGRRQAEGLVVRLEDYPIERILCSPTRRCLQTVEPLAGERRLRVEPAAALGVESDAAEVLAMIRDQELRDAVLCTHGETIGRLLGQLVTDGLVLGGPLYWPKGSTWLLEADGQRQVRARYLPPLAYAPHAQAGADRLHPFAGSARERRSRWEPGLREGRRHQGRA